MQNVRIELVTKKHWHHSFKLPENCLTDIILLFSAWKVFNWTSVSLKLSEKCVIVHLSFCCMSYKPALRFQASSNNHEDGVTLVQTCGSFEAILWYIEVLIKEALCIAVKLAQKLCDSWIVPPS